MRIILLIGVIFLIAGEAFSFAFNNVLLRPDKTIRVKFESVPPIMKFAGDIGVYYRGYKVGKATCKNLSKDQKHILFCLDINYKDLKLPTNTEIILKTQDIFGDRYFDLIYPQKPSNKFLADGDIVEGTAVYERVDKYLVEQLEKGKMGSLISNLNYLAGNLRMMFEGDRLSAKELENITGGAAAAVDDLSYITKELKVMLKDPEFRKTLLKAPEHLGTTTKQLAVTNAMLPVINNNLDQVGENFYRAHQDFEMTNEILTQTNAYLPEVNDELKITNPLLFNTNQQLGCLNPKIPVIPQDLVWQADKTLKRYDCIGGALSKTMSKNCLFFRFLFGRPGEPFKECIFE